MKPSGTREEIFNKFKQLIGQVIYIEMDRPVGTHHPKHDDIIYPINYGYIKELVSLDGEYSDVYVLGCNIPLKACKAKVIAICQRDNDNEDKLVASLDNYQYSDEEILEKISFQEQFYIHRIIR